MDSTHEDQVRAAVADYVAATAAGQDDAAARARGRVADLCFTAVDKAATKVIKPLEEDREDVAAVAQLVFFEVLPDHMLRFDPMKVRPTASGKPGTFAGWVLYGWPAWGNELRRELDRVNGTAGINAADNQMARMYHGCREHFTAVNGRDWTPQEAYASVWEYLFETAKAKCEAKHPDWDQGRVAKAARARITRDGHMRTLRELDEVVRLQAAARAASLDAPLTGDGSTTLGETLADELADEEAAGHDPATYSAWVRLATLGMRPSQVRAFARQVDEPSGPTDAEVAAHSQRNLRDPLAQFAVLADVEAQFETQVASGSSSALEVREQLVLAANLS